MRLPNSANEFEADATHPMNSQILVSQTVKDLTAGSNLTLEDAGEHELTASPDRWRYHRVVG